MRVVIRDDAGRELAVFDVNGEVSGAYPVDPKARAKVVEALTEALRYLLGIGRGKLDYEI